MFNDFIRTHWEFLPFCLLLTFALAVGLGSLSQDDQTGGGSR